MHHFSQPIYLFHFFFVLYFSHFDATLRWKYPPKNIAQNLYCQLVLVVTVVVVRAGGAVDPYSLPFIWYLTVNDTFETHKYPSTWNENNIPFQLFLLYLRIPLAIFLFHSASLFLSLLFFWSHCAFSDGNFFKTIAKVIIFLSMKNHPFPLFPIQVCIRTIFVWNKFFFFWFCSILSFFLAFVYYTYVYAKISILLVYSANFAHT